MLIFIKYIRSLLSYHFLSVKVGFYSA